MSDQSDRSPWQLHDIRRRRSWADPRPMPEKVPEWGLKPNPPPTWTRPAKPRPYVRRNTDVRAFCERWPIAIRLARLIY